MAQADLWKKLPPYQFGIQSVEDFTTFISDFGDGAPLVVDGYGGWTVTTRPKEIGIAEWAGRNPMAVEIPFVVDNYLLGVNGGILTERQVTALETLCGLGSHDIPPICVVHGGGAIPHDEESAPGSHKWVIESVVWDRDIEVRSEASQRRLMCGGTLTIRQFITASDILRRLGPNTRASKPKIYIVKRGDTLSKIAAKFYGDSKKWKKIADANHIRDPRSLKIGAKIRIPS